MAITVSTLGFPRIGPRRELKAALESYWAGRIDAATLQARAAELRAANWQVQHAAGITAVPSNDFSFYDHVLDTSVMVGAIPKLYADATDLTLLDRYFAMARGTRGRKLGDLPALEMTKWFDTNYHYMVPLFSAGQQFALGSTKAVDEFLEAKGQGVVTRPVLLGPVSYLLLGKAEGETFDPLTLLPNLLPVYGEVLQRLATAGAGWVQFDEPCLALDLNDAAHAALKYAYAALAKAAPGLRLLVASYFGSLGDNLGTAVRLPVAGLHIDLVRGAGQLDAVLNQAPPNLALSLGVIDGRNVWRADLEAALDRIQPVTATRGVDKVMISSSCSLIHVPIDLELETALDAELKSWLAFARQKVDELTTLGAAIDRGRDAVRDRLAASAAAAATRRTSTRIHDPSVQARLGRTAMTPGIATRGAPFGQRRLRQQDRFGLPAFPTTTIGSFPQTEEVRRARASFAKGDIDQAAYDGFLRQATETAVRWQEEVGIDVLVHGEFERNDMVQYFGEQLAGYAFTKAGWVQSYGSRYVRPPIIFGDVSRPRAMTVDWTSYAQSLTKRPMKGMLTGPVTMLQWSFVRDDQPRERTCRQIALALRDEVADLEAAGIGIIQIDEPAIREGLPLRRAEWPAYLAWAVECFRLSSSGVADDTQIHTHMCYSEFNDIIDSIGAMDADVISIETSRSRMELLDAFVTYRYPNEIGPGVYDIHAPRVPPVEEMVALLARARDRLNPDQIWVNPDCGLKTRGWDEVRPALVNMVEAARRMRDQG